eukprot:128364-Prymnesium_polylepis.1
MALQLDMRQVVAPAGPAAEAEDSTVAACAAVISEEMTVAVAHRAASVAAVGREEQVVGKRGVSRSRRSRG